MEAGKNHRAKSLDGILGRSDHDDFKYRGGDSRTMGGHKTLFSGIKAMKCMNCTINAILIFQLLFFGLQGYFAVIGWEKTAKESVVAAILVHLNANQLSELDIKSLDI